MKQIKIIDVGSDIELFLQDKDTKEIISAEGFIKGTKYEPFVFDEQNKYFATSLDNVLMEFCIPPAKTAEEFYNNITKSMDYINSTLPDDLCAAILPSANLESRWLTTPQAINFGCEPDFNAYTGYFNQRPHSKDNTLRSAGLHLHIGYEDAEKFHHYQYYGDKTRCSLIKTLDLFLGVPSVLIEPENKRRELYGKAGAFRPKSYGVEYRTLSNYFVSDKGKIMWLHETTHKAAEWINAGNVISDQLASVIQKTINTNDKVEAEHLVKAFNLQF